MDLHDWLTTGPTPNYDHLLHEVEEVDGIKGPWTLLNGFIEETSSEYNREIFTFLRGVLVDLDNKDDLISTFNDVEYPGNDAIPEEHKGYYTYAGEIPWSTRFGTFLRSSDKSDPRDVQDAFSSWTGERQVGIPVEIPIWRFCWESYHSELNSVGNIITLAPALCEKLKLTNRRGEWDLYDSDGNVATLYREAPTNDISYQADLLYIRTDLLHKYLNATDQTMVWLLWGERGFKEYHAEMTMRFRDVYQEYLHIHKHVYQLTSSTKDK